MLRRSVFVILAGGTLAIAAGCNQPRTDWGRPKNQHDPGANVRVSPVQKVVCLFDPTPQQFKSLDPDGDPNPEGFACTVYLVSRETSKGILADGKLQARMYRVDVLPDGTVQRPLVYESQAVPTKTVTRSTRPSQFGWAYVPIFYWGDADVLGCEVEIVVEYVTPDGIKTRSQTHSFKVPARKL